MDAMALAAILPAVNACLNASSAIWLIAGVVCIRRRRVSAHRRCMLAAFGVSCLFLASYLTLRGLAGMSRFPGEGWVRRMYLAILLVHSILAAPLVPMVLVTLRHAVRAAFDRHVRVARIVLPLWLTVSVSGVLVYLMLSHLAPGH